MEGIQIQEGVKLFPFADTVILHLKDLKDSTKRILDLIDKFRR
jgi:hypothetical protein